MGISNRASKRGSASSPICCSCRMRISSRRVLRPAARSHVRAAVVCCVRVQDRLRALLHDVPLAFPRSEDMKLSRSIRHRSEEHTSELQSLMRISYAVFCLKKKTQENTRLHHT